MAGPNFHQLWDAALNLNGLTNPILSFTPGIAIGLVVFGFNMMGDGLRDSLDSRLRGLL